MSPKSPSDASEEVERLDRKAGALRADLDEILGELDRRQHASMRFIGPVAAGALALAAAALALKAWRRLRGRTRFKLRPSGHSW